tara:strand:+ start:36 stop:314 length:279 start_codon:yes stop_codon:yes gene_type:complete
MNTATKTAAIYTITVGNIVERKGHRASCSQVVVELDVRAASEAEAVAIVKRAAKRGDVLTNTWLLHGIVATRVTLNPELYLPSRNVRTVATS